MIVQEYAWFISWDSNLTLQEFFFRFIKAWIENQSNCKIQVLRSNKGKEYVSDQFNSFYEKVGIEQQLTTPYIPQ